MSSATQALRTLMLALLAGLSLPLAAQTPFGNPIALPGTFEAENFDNGGEGVAYHDNVAGNAGGQYRTSESVDIIVSRDPAGGGYVVDNFETGEWLVYTVDIAAAGQYEIAIRAASGTFTGAFRIEIDGANVTGTVVVPPTGNFGTFQWVAKRGVSLPAGRHALKLVSEQQYFDVNQIRVTATPTAPFAALIQLPGTFEAENFDNGGEGVAYHDNVAGNAGGQYRINEDVDIIASRDPDGGGYSVNNFEPGEWLVYTVNVGASGLYDIDLRVASGTSSTGAFHIEIDGANVTGSIIVPATGSFGTFQWVGKKSVPLGAGQHVFKLVADQQYFDVNQIRVTQVLHAPFSGTPIALPGTFEAEDFDNGGEGNAYHDNVAGNAGGQYRTSESVDIVVSRDPNGGGYSVNNFETGEWLIYTVNVAQNGLYDIELRLASGTFTTSAFHVEIDGKDVTGRVAVPATGSFSTFQWVGKKAVALTGGQHVLKLVADQQYFDVNQVRVVASTTPPANPASLLFRSGFETGVSVGAPRDCYSAGCWQDMLGTDSSTGFAWPPIIAGGTAGFQVRSGTNTNPTSTTISNYIVNELRTVTGHKGTSTQALYSEIKRSCSGTAPADCSSQDPYHLLHASEPGDMYISFWRKLQPDLFQKMAAGTWFVIYEWKTVGDFRVSLQIVNYGGTPRWQMRADNVANGGLPYQEYWRVENYSVPIPVNQWFKFEIFWHRSSGADGRVWMAVNGQVLVDKFAPNIGVHGDHIDRNMIHQLYTGGAYPAYQWTDDVQIWSGFPTASPGDPWYDPPYGPH